MTENTDIFHVPVAGRRYGYLGERVKLLLLALNAKRNLQKRLKGDPLSLFISLTQMLFKNKLEVRMQRRTDYEDFFLRPLAEKIPF